MDINNLLFKACIHRDITKIKYLLSKGADVNFSDSCCLQQMLHKKGNDDIAKLLIDNGADIFIYNYSYLGTPIRKMLWDNNAELIEYILKGKGIDILSDNIQNVISLFTDCNKDIINMVMSSSGSIDNQLEIMERLITVVGGDLHYKNYDLVISYKEKLELTKELSLNNIKCNLDDDVVGRN